jgi:hypothetical protein
LDATESSLRADPAAATPTTVTFRFPPEVDVSAWRIVGDLARYTALIVLYRPTYPD